MVDIPRVAPYFNSQLSYLPWGNPVRRKSGVVLPRISEMTMLHPTTFVPAVLSRRRAAGGGVIPLSSVLPFGRF
jgi:hypothetical protein